MTRVTRDFRNIDRLNDPQAKTHVVYFMYCAGFVKIGFCNSIVRRQRDLQIGRPWQVQTILLIRGGRATETFLHFAFDAHRIGGEWFRLGPEVREAIKELSPADFQGILEKEEEEHLEWVREEAIRLGLLPEKGKLT